jgi:hypothetical protein
MPDDVARIRFEGNTAKLDAELDKTRLKLKRSAELTADEVARLGDRLNRRAQDQLNAMGRQSQATAVAATAPMLKLKQDYTAFSGVALRVGAGVATAIYTAVSAAKAGVQALAEAREKLAKDYSSNSTSALDVATSLQRSGIRDVQGLMLTAQQALGPVKQSQINEFLKTAAESGVATDDERMGALVESYAKYAPILGKGESLVAVQKLAGDTFTGTPKDIASNITDAAVSYRLRTGKDLSINEVDAVNEKVDRARQSEKKAKEEYEKAKRRHVSPNEATALREKVNAAVNETAMAERQRKDFAANLEYMPGQANAAMLDLGGTAQTTMALAAMDRGVEVMEFNKSMTPAALTQAIKERSEKLSEEQRRDLFRKGGLANWTSGTATASLENVLDPAIDKLGNITGLGKGKLQNSAEKQAMELMADQNRILRSMDAALKAQTELLKGKRMRTPANTQVLDP